MFGVEESRVPEQLGVIRGGHGKWVLESSQGNEQLSAEGNFFLMPVWAPSPLCGCLEKGFLAEFAPSLVLTKYLLFIAWQALHSHLIFPGQVLNSLGSFVFHLAGLGPRPFQQAHAGVVLPHGLAES